MGVASKRSIAWGIATSANREGARLALAYQSERLADNLRELAPALRDPLLLQCDVASDAQIDALMERLRETVGHLDFLVHALAFAPREALTGRFADTTRGRLRGGARRQRLLACVRVARAALPLMQGRQASIVTLTYLGSERVAPRLQRDGAWPRPRSRHRCAISRASSGPRGSA